MAKTVRINGKAFDDGSVIIRIAGVEYEGVKAIKYAQKRERSPVYVRDRRRGPVTYTAGKVTTEAGSITIIKEHAKLLRDNLAAKSADGSSYGDPSFVITVQMVEPGLTPQIDELFGCYLTGDEGGTEEGPDPLYEEIPFVFTELKRDGKSLATARRG